MNDIAVSEDTTQGNNEPTLDELLNKRAEQKAIEDAAKNERRAIEAQIIDFGLVDRHPQGHGGKTTKSAEFKTVIKDEKKGRLRKEGRETPATWGDIWNACNAAGFDDDDMPVKLTREIDIKKLNLIQENYPELYLQLSELIERYDGNPGFTVTRV